MGQLPPGQQDVGSGAGELDNPLSLAADSDTGRIYIADRRNARVSEYTAWGFFVKSWGWGVKDGSAELQTCGPSEPEEVPDPSLCQKGLTGAGKGQMELLTGGMAVDGDGDVWVGDLENLRVQKFTPEGEFLLMLGGDVNKTKVEEGAPAAQRNVCPVAPTDVCQAGISGEGPSQLSGTIGDYIAFSPVENAILVGDKDGIQVFNLDGSFKKEISFEGELAAFAGELVNAIDVDKDGNIYFSLSGVEDVYKISASGVPLAPGTAGESQFAVGNPLGIAVDIEKNVYVVDDPPGELSEQVAKVIKFDQFGVKLVPTKAEEEEASGLGSGKLFPYIPFHGPSVPAIAVNFCADSAKPGNLYVAFFASGVISYVNAYGSAPVGCEPPPPRPPLITTQFATSVGQEEATVRAQINPLFWPDATYYVEYGTGKCTEAGCLSKAPLSPGLLTNQSVNAALTTMDVELGGLIPGTTYHYRFVAQSGGGGPVFGIDPDGQKGSAQASPEEGLEATFTTFRPAGPFTSCANHALRGGQAAKLPDCRAYEMVSPVDKGGGDVATWEGRNGIPPPFFELHQSATSGDRFTYTSAFAFADPASAPFVSQYLAERGAIGWSSNAISPKRAESPVGTTTLLSGEFHGFSQDLCRAWLRHYSVAPLTADAVARYVNSYRRENCPKPPTYVAVTTEEPSNRAPDEYVQRTLGFSADGTHTIFAANGKLADAPALEGLLLYEYASEGLRFVCYLPNGEPISQACSAGTVGGLGIANQSALHNAISEDGSHIFWSAYSGSPGFGTEPGAPGQIYVRIEGQETRKVSTSVAGDPAWYWTAADDGSKAIFAFDSGPRKDELYELDVDTETPTLIAKEVEGPMGASEDASRIYFASKEDLDGSGGPGTTGQHNLYLYETDAGGGKGGFSFVMELAKEDIGGTDTDFSPIDEVPSQRAASVSSDGLHAAFISSASPTPTGFDNRDAHSGLPVPEVYLYDAASSVLRCISCNPTGARPTGENIGGELFPSFAAARIQGWEALLHAPRVLSDDGTRVFFESFEALVPRDTNSNWDVYQWEEAGKGTCKASSETFSGDSGGCVDLISSGTSTAKSTFLDADPSGDNIFFSTQSSLVKADYGLNDVYVARVGGGFPEPQPQAECEGEACQSPPPPPPEVTPSTELSQGAGNVAPTKARRCPKGKRRVRRAGKVKCLKRKAAHRRRASR